MPSFYLGAVIVQIVDRSTFPWIPGLPSIKTISLPFGMHITYYEVTLGIFSVIQGLMGLAATAYIVWCGVSFYLGGSRREAVPLLVALGVMTAVAINDTAVSNGLYQCIYLIEYGYVAMVLLMAFSFSRTVVDAAMAREALRQITDHGVLDPGIDFIQKPFNSQEFLAKVREILNRQQRSDFRAEQAFLRPFLWVTLCNKCLWPNKQ